MFIELDLSSVAGTRDLHEQAKTNEEIVSIVVWHRKLYLTCLCLHFLPKCSLKYYELSRKNWMIDKILSIYGWFN